MLMYWCGKVEIMKCIQQFDVSLQGFDVGILTALTDLMMAMLVVLAEINQVNTKLLLSHGEASMNFAKVSGS